MQYNLRLDSRRGWETNSFDRRKVLNFDKSASRLKNVHFGGTWIACATEIQERRIR